MSVGAENVVTWMPRLSAAQTCHIARIIRYIGDYS